MAEPLGDRDYFALRAAQERAIASTCEDNAVALVHFRMADEYDRCAAEAGKAGVQRHGEADTYANLCIHGATPSP